MWDLLQAIPKPGKVNPVISIDADVQLETSRRLEPEVQAT
jgi:hypothetical protein